MQCNSDTTCLELSQISRPKAKPTSRLHSLQTSTQLSGSHQLATHLEISNNATGSIIHQNDSQTQCHTYDERFITWDTNRRQTNEENHRRSETFYVLGMYHPQGTSICFMTKVHSKTVGVQNFYGGFITQTLLSESSAT